MQPKLGSQAGSSATQSEIGLAAGAAQDFDFLPADNADTRTKRLGDGFFGGETRCKGGWNPSYFFQFSGCKYTLEKTRPEPLDGLTHALDFDQSTPVRRIILPDLNSQDCRSKDGRMKMFWLQGDDGNPVEDDFTRRKTKQ
jgi:hypothetical protein